MGPIAQKILVAALVRIIESQVTPADIKVAADQLVAFLKKKSAESETKIDDAVVAAVEGMVTADSVQTVVKYAVLLADQYADSTPNQVDDVVVEAVAKAVKVELPKEG
jgi:hypothetical protein